MGQRCSTHGRREKCIKISVERDHLEDLDIDGKIM
jgi:hypothetical protein